MPKPKAFPSTPSPMPTLVFDCETTGLMQSLQARPIQLGWIVLNDAGEEQDSYEFLIKTVEHVPIIASAIHKIDTQKLLEYGLNPPDVLKKFGLAIDQIQKVGGRIVAHNADFDVNMLRRVYNDYNITEHMNINIENVFCTMKESTKWCKLPPMKYNTYKWPKLYELANALDIHYDSSILHGAREDARLTGKAYMAGVISGWWVLAPSLPDKDEDLQQNAHYPPSI